jgi:hypothetical protein
MGKRTTAGMLLLTLAACGGGGGVSGSSNGGSASAYGTVTLLSHTPADGEVQVALDAELVFVFDAAMALDSFGDEDTKLVVAGGTAALAGSFRGGSNGRVTFRPASALLPETDYEFRLSALTCDGNGRIVDIEHRFSFRTLDATPPTLVGLDVPAGAQNQSRTRTFTATFSEVLQQPVDADGLFLRDSFGRRYGAVLRVDGPRVILDPDADLPGDRQFALVVGTALRDRAGNRLMATSTTGFRTAIDLTSPTVVSGWPTDGQTGLSPRVQPTFAFDESMDPDTVEASSLTFEDQFGSVVPFAIESTADQRRLRVRPLVTLQTNRRYSLTFLLGGAAATDVSGNPLVGTQSRTFTTGTDAEAPTLASSVPAAGDAGVPGHATLSVRFAEPIDSNTVDDSTVRLTIGGEAWPGVVDLATADTVRFTPLSVLPPGRDGELRIESGQDGVRDRAGNALPDDLAIPFRTSSDTGNPTTLLLPGDDATNVPLDARIVVVFDAVMAPATLSAATILFTDDVGTPLPGQLAVLAGDRAVAFVPTAPLLPQQFYRTFVRGGALGVRRASGVWLDADREARFRTGTTNDSLPPAVTATFNGIPVARQQGLVLPSHGFTTSDANGQQVDMASIAIELAGPGTSPGTDQLLAGATIELGRVRAPVPASAALAPGDWTLVVRARDLSGNVGATAAIPFAVAAADADLLPFERTQLVWVRTDLDRDSRGEADFDDDLVRLGLRVDGDPAGSNAFVRSVVLGGILARANLLYGRGRRGEPLDADSVPLRFTTRQPISLPHMQIALGGLDPEANSSRRYGDASSGVLGRAYFDYRNGDVAERNIASSPGLGVFPGEMWLYQTKVHIDVWPSFQTLFAQRFRPLCPDMGGVPAGNHPLDAQVLRTDFDYANADGNQRARWNAVMNAADDWASVIGIILAHEVGHSVGLVASGPAPRGLFGDSSLHNTFAGAAEVMAPAVGYEAMVTLDYAFRDIDLAYLRQRVLLR